MLNRLSNWFCSQSSGWIVLASLIIFLLFSMTVLPSQSALANTYSAGVGAPDTSLFYTPQDLYRMAEVYGVEGRQAYVRARFRFDLVFPLIYTFFLTTGISWLYKRLPEKNNLNPHLNLLPLGAMLLDFLENISAASVISAYPSTQPILACLAAIFYTFEMVVCWGEFSIPACCRNYVCLGVAQRQ